MARESGDAVLEVSDVSVRFGGLQALDNVGLRVRRGGIAGLIGPNGAGKTTLFNVVTGLLEPTSGSVELDGEDITRWPPHRRGRAGISRTFQRLELFRGLSVYDNLLATWEAGVAGAVLGRNRRQARDRVDEVIDQLGLADCADRQAGQLSTGLGRMVELGRALCANPRVLLLDEPSAGLDPGETARFRDMLLGVVGRESGEPAILLVEHDVALVMEVCDEITVLDFGQRIARGTPKEIRDDPDVIAAYLGEEKAAS
ncbi:MAG: branched-chain amino acid transport system ATP-binding protein [Actinomycetota bacterium]|jgi:branched-chain amino acid transport system ATP-binding protein